MAAVVAGSMVGGTRFHPDVIQSECSRVWSSTWLAHSPCLRHATGIVYLDNAFVLIEGHPLHASCTQEPKWDKGGPPVQTQSLLCSKLICQRHSRIQPIRHSP